RRQKHEIPPEAWIPLDAGAGDDRQSNGRVHVRNPHASHTAGILEAERLRNGDENDLRRPAQDGHECVRTVDAGLPPAAGGDEMAENVTHAREPFATVV